MKKYIGTIASTGLVKSRVKILHNEDDFFKVEEGDIIVVHNSSPAWTIPLMKSSGMICEVGGIASHIAIICRELSVPCITGIEGITSKLHDGETVWIDCNLGEVCQFE